MVASGGSQVRNPRGRDFGRGVMPAFAQSLFFSRRSWTRYKKLDSMLNSNYQDVINFFQPSGNFTSFGGNLTTTLNNLNNSAPYGAIYLALHQNSSEEVQLNTYITNENTTISAEQTQLTTELNQANYTLQAIPSQLQEVNEMYSAITGYNQNTNG